jgi:hypothetical protein
MATSTIKTIQDETASYMQTVVEKARAGRLKPHEANVAAAVMAGYFNWTEAISKRELVERAGAIVDAAQALREQGELQLASAGTLNAKLQVSKTGGRRKTAASK